MKHFKAKLIAEIACHKQHFNWIGHFFLFRLIKKSINRYKHKIGNFKWPNLLTDGKLNQKIKIQILVISYITWNKC